VNKNNSPAVPSQAPQPIQAAIYVDYIYLDTEERRRMAQQSHEYLIEQTQYNEDKGISSYSNRIDLTFNHPVKELIWVVQPSTYTNCTLAKSDGLTRLQPFTYNNQAVFEQFLQINGQDRMEKRYGNYFNTTQQFQHHTGSGGTYQINGLVTYNISSIVMTSGTSNVTVSGNAYLLDGLSVTISGCTNAGNNGTFTATTSAQNIFNFSNGSGVNENPTNAVVTFTNPAKAFGGIVPQSDIYSYSFALRPEEHQPSGTCNFSRIDTATIVMTMSGANNVVQRNDNNWDVRVYAINYNILRVMSGMGGLAFSN
jgi:hypothetical protein